MSRGISPIQMVGNEFVLPQPRLRVEVPVVSAPAPAESVIVRLDAPAVHKESIFRRAFEFMHRYSIGVFAILLLLVVASGIQVASIYWSARYAPVALASAKHLGVTPLHGPNMAVAAKELPKIMQTLSAQTITLTVGSKNVAFAPETISTWFKTVVDQKTQVAYIHVNDKEISAALAKTVAPFAYGAIDQLTLTHEDGTSRILTAGRNGTSLTDTSQFTKQIADSVLGAKGMQMNVPLQTVPFHALTQANFDKLIEVDVTTKRMYMYHGGTIERTFLISAGAPVTPTPLGQFKISSKLTRQDMRGFNANGTKYFQPNVQWINYFSGGNAIHGNYWRPLSWFGNINSSHGCVSLPNDEAHWVYEWAPIGTTIVTHA